MYMYTEIDVIHIYIYIYIYNTSATLKKVNRRNRLKSTGDAASMWATLVLAINIK